MPGTIPVGATFPTLLNAPERLAVILQLNPPLPMVTPKGEGWAHFEDAQGHCRMESAAGVERRASGASAQAEELSGGLAALPGSGGTLMGRPGCR
jgi:hypothetical protein